MADMPQSDPGSGTEPPQPHDRPEVWGPRLLRIIEQQLQQFRELDQLSSSQTAMIAEGRADELLSLLGSRQVVVDRITELNGELEPFLANWGALADALPETLRESIRSRRSELDDPVQTIAERDQADQKSLEQRRLGVQNELSALSRSRNAVNAYAATGSQQQRPHYQDRQG